MKKTLAFDDPRSAWEDYHTKIDADLTITSREMVIAQRAFISGMLAATALILYSENSTEKLHEIYADLKRIYDEDLKS